MPSPTVIQYLPSGRIAVSQLPVNGWDISYNPDDDRWYVCDPVTMDAIKIYAELRNARYWAKRNAVPVQPGEVQ